VTLFVRLYIRLIWAFEAPGWTSNAPLPQTLVHGTGRASVVHADRIKKTIDSSGQEAELYSWSLYGQLGLPVWEPTHVEVGPFGYFLNGRFEPFNMNILDGGNNPFSYRSSSVKSPLSASSHSCPQPRWILCPSMTQPSRVTPHEEE
jgi:hypothetical protein